MTNTEGVFSGMVLSQGQNQWDTDEGSLKSRVLILLGHDNRYYLVQINDIEGTYQFACGCLGADSIDDLYSHVKPARVPVADELVERIFDLAREADADLKADVDDV